MDERDAAILPSSADTPNDFWLASNALQSARFALQRVK
jgi:hypothetical protein